MIAFSIFAESNIGYSSPIYQQWTEGEMWLAEAALGVAGGVPGTKFFRRDYLGGITKGFLSFYGDGGAKAPTLSLTVNL